MGRLKQSRWEENNKKHSRVYVVAEHVEYKFSKPKPEEKAPEVVQAEATVDAATEPAKEAATAEAVF